MLNNPLFKQLRPLGIPDYRVEFYVNASIEHEWRIIANKNGKIVAASSEGFNSKQNCQNNFKLLQDFLKSYTIS